MGILKNKRTSNDDITVFKSVIKIEVVGFNQMRILNKLSANGIAIRNISRLSAKLIRFQLNKKDSIKAFAILDEMCYTYSIIKQTGIKQILGSFWTHIGFAAGIIIFIAAIMVFNSLVWRIDIDGNQLVSSQIIEKQLNLSGVKTGAFKHKLNLDAITIALRDIDGLAEGTVEVRGTTVYVKVLEEKDYIAPDTDNQPCDITSNYDAVITRVVAQNGVSMVRVGDIIQKGGMLIKGEVYNINNELIGTCKAKGKVYGKVSFTSTHIFSPTEIYHERTGKEKTFTSISLFSINIGKKSQPSWQKTTTQEKMFLIPVTITRTVCYETVQKERQIDIDEHVERLKDEAVLQNVINAGGSQIETITTITTLPSGHIMLNIHILAEMLLN